MIPDLVIKVIENLRKSLDEDRLRELETNRVYNFENNLSNKSSLNSENLNNSKKISNTSPDSRQKNSTVRVFSTPNKSKSPIKDTKVFQSSILRPRNQVNNLAISNP